VFVGSCTLNTKILNVGILKVPFIRRAEKEINQRGVDQMVASIGDSNKVPAGIDDTVDRYQAVIEFVTVMDMRSISVT
jgi:hypothetical protein